MHASSSGWPVQFGVYVASSIAMVASRRPQVSRSSVSWQPHSSTTSVPVAKPPKSTCDMRRRCVCDVEDDDDDDGDVAERNATGWKKGRLKNVGKLLLNTCMNMYEKHTDIE